MTLSILQFAFYTSIFAVAIPHVSGKGGWSGGRGGSLSRGGSKGGGRMSLWGVKSTPYSSYRPSPQFNSFMYGAGFGYLTGRSHPYYYPLRSHSYPSGWDRGNVCKFEATLSEIQNTSAANLTQSISAGPNLTYVYFLCDGTCCGADCCDLNAGTIVFAVLFPLLVIGICLLYCCRRNLHCFKTHDKRSRRTSFTAAYPSQPPTATNFEPPPAYPTAPPKSDFV